MLMFDYVRKFEMKYGREIFKDEGDIYKVVVEEEYDVHEGESAVRLCHTNGLRMSVIFCSNVTPNRVRVTVDRTVYNIEDWFDLKIAATLWDEKNAQSNKNHNDNNDVWDVEVQVPVRKWTQIWKPPVSCVSCRV